MKEKRTRKNQDRNPVKCNVVDCVGEHVLFHCIEIVGVEYQLHVIAAVGISSAINEALKRRRKRSPDIQSDCALSWCMVQESTEDDRADKADSGGGLDNLEGWWIGNTVVVHFKDLFHAWENVHDVGGFKVQRCLA